MRATGACSTEPRLGQAVDANSHPPLLVLGRTPLALTFSALALGLKPALTRGRGGTSRATVLGDGQRRRKPFSQASQCQLSITGLRALVLGDRNDAGTDTRQYSIPLR